VRSGRIKVVAAASIAMLGLAACSNDATSAPPEAGGTTTTAPSGGSGSGSPAVRPTLVVSNSGLGAILTDDRGNTVYLFEMDRADKSACYEGCESTWPPLEASGRPTGGDGVLDALLGTIERTDGTIQVTYADHPIYRYSGDKVPGDTNGQDIGGVWYVVAPSGDPVEGGGGAGGAGGTGGYGGGYG
jgi:predicted lipoprotein with Yx(FWY)xxD motif